MSREIWEKKTVSTWRKLCCVLFCETPHDSLYCVTFQGFWVGVGCGGIGSFFQYKSVLRLKAVLSYLGCSRYRQFCNHVSSDFSVCAFSMSTGW